MSLEKDTKHILSNSQDEEDLKRQQEIVSGLLEIIDTHFLETSSQTMVLAIRKALVNYDSNGIYME